VWFNGGMSTDTTHRNPWSVGKYERNYHFGYMRAAIVDRISHDFEQGVWSSGDGESSVTAVTAYGKAYLVWESSDGFVTVVEYPNLSSAQRAGRDAFPYDEEDYQ
jgi:hypothetical protein